MHLPSASLGRSTAGQSNPRGKPRVAKLQSPRSTYPDETYSFLLTVTSPGCKVSEIKEKVPSGDFMDVTVFEGVGEIVLSHNDTGPRTEPQHHNNSRIVIQNAADTSGYCFADLSSPFPTCEAVSASGISMTFGCEMEDIKATMTVARHSDSAMAVVWKDVPQSLMMNSGQVIFGDVNTEIGPGYEDLGHCARSSGILDASEDSMGYGTRRFLLVPAVFEECNKEDQQGSKSYQSVRIVPYIVTATQEPYSPDERLYLESTDTLKEAFAECDLDWQW